MSQIGTIVSYSPLMWGNDWVVLFQYQLDAGGMGQSEIVVGNTPPPRAMPSFPPTVPFWVSATSTIQVNAPGSTNPVLLSCPPIIQWAAFGYSLGGMF